MLSETFEQVKEKLQRCSWDVMDEEQRDDVIRKVVVPRWGETTRDGVVLKATKWAEILGTTVDTIDGRYRRLRRSQAVSEPSAPPEPTTNEKGWVRSARNTIKKYPELATEILKDPEVMKAIENVIAEDPEAVTRVVELRKNLGLPESEPDSDDVPPPAPDINDEWMKWLTQLNTFLTRGARLAERTDDDMLAGPAVMAYALYQRFSETQITTETKNLDEELRLLLGDR